MALTKTEKTEIINQFATKSGDTGSPEVQIALLSKRIAQLTDHQREQTRREFTPWSAETGWSAPSSFGLLAPEGLRTLHDHHRNLGHPQEVISEVQ